MGENEEGETSFTYLQNDQKHQLSQLLHALPDEFLLKFYTLPDGIDCVVFGCLDYELALQQFLQRQ